MLIVKREELALPSSYPARVVYDRFKAQCTDGMLQLLRENHIDSLLIPASCTDQLQPLDVSVNKPAKEFLRKSFSFGIQNKYVANFKKSLMK